MKKKIALAILAISTIGIAQNYHSEKSKELEVERKHECIFMWAGQNGNSGKHGYTYDGAKIYCSSHSIGAEPKFQQQEGQTTTNLMEHAEGIAIYINKGYHIFYTGDGGLTVGM